MPAKKGKNKDLQTRPPVVVILGHVDHGKTSILDFIRKSKVAEKESGGITQHTGAYQVEQNGHKITFIDTPGHEAFSAMRSRGAKVADIAILVIAAEEGLKPQTKEAIKHIKKTGIPMIVAFNKIDKPEAQVEKIKGQLMEQDVIVESMGGQIPSVKVSAKSGQGIDELLEMISLVAEMEELKSDPSLPAQGVIVESNCNTQRGNTATIILKQGTLANTDIIGTGSAFGKIKIMEDFQGNSIKKASASDPVIVTGFNHVPQVGEKIYVFETLNQAQAKVDQKSAKTKEETEVLDIGDKKILNIILKADVHGCLEAIKQALKAIPDDEVILRILKSEVGEINESDLKTAESAKARIIGFKTKANANISKAAQNKGIKIFTYDIIYELIQGARELMSKLIAPEVIREDIGQLKVLAIFRTEKDRQIIGGKIIDGQAIKGAKIDVIREGRKIGAGHMVSLQRDKKEIEEVNKGQECGVLFKGSVIIEKDDILQFFSEKKVKKEL